MLHFHFPKIENRIQKTETEASRLRAGRGEVKRLLTEEKDREDETGEKEEEVTQVKSSVESFDSAFERVSRVDVSTNVNSFLRVLLEHVRDKL